MWGVSCPNLGGLYFPKILWSFWNKDSLPEDVEEMVKVSEKSLANFSHVFLTPSNLSDYLNMSFFSKFYAVSPAIMGDYVRINLVAEYGGIWMDCTAYINSAFEFERFFSEGINGKREVYGFDIGVEKEFLLSLNFFGGCGNGTLMKRLKAEFDVCWETGAKKYIRRACSILLPNKAIAKMHCKAYFSMFTTFIMITYNNDTLKNAVFFIKKDRRLNFELLIQECSFAYNCVKNRLLYDPVARSYPIIKVWHKYRNGKKFHIGDAEYDLSLKMSPKEFMLN